MGGKKKGGGSAQDPKSAALAHLGIAIGSKNVRNLKKEEIDVAFIHKLHDSEYSPELYIHPPRVPTKRAFQRSLHESYQYMMKSIVDQANQEANRRKRLQAASAAVAEPLVQPAENPVENPESGENKDEDSKSDGEASDEFLDEELSVVF